MKLITEQTKTKIEKIVINCQTSTWVESKLLAREFFTHRL